MSLKEESPKDTYIKLMLANESEANRATSIEECCKVVDITDAVLEEDVNFGHESIIGFTFGTENRGQGWAPVFYQWRLFDKICRGANRIFDASIVNEKQKQAVKSLFESKLVEVFEGERKALDIALSTLKEQE